MAKCLVLGANGFIGSHLVDSLVENKHHVRVFDRFGDKIVRFKESKAIENYPGDFLNHHDLREALRGVEYVFHFISTTTPITADEDPLIDVETNIRMSIELLKECVANGGVKKVIFASTGGAIYGLNSGEFVSEDITPLPISPYAIGKLTIEHYLRYFQKKHGLNSVVYRISNPYGERQSLASKQGVIPIFLHHVANHEPLTVLGDGTMIRDYIYVKDVANMIAGSFADANHDLYNLGYGEGISVNELVTIIGRVTGEKIETINRPNLPTFVQKIVLDTSRFTSEFKLYPTINIEEGVHKTWAYINKAAG